MTRLQRGPHLIGFARQNRQGMTDAEVRLWIELRRLGLGVSFRRHIR